MTDLYLIAHKVSGSPAFDIACQMICPECDNDPGCGECDGLGYWWIIPTSGHRAYPYWSVHFNQIDWEMFRIDGSPLPDTMPEGLPDHYPHSSSTTPKLSLADRLGITKRPAPLAPFPRRL